MTHRPDVQTLADVLPSLVRWAASGLAPEAAPTAQSLGGRTPCILVTAEHPEGRELVSETAPSSIASSALQAGAGGGERMSVPPGSGGSCVLSLSLSRLF